MPPTSTGVHARDLHYEIANRVILDSLTLHVASGESVAITGPSGCGKSTLLSCLAGLTPPIRGTVTVDGYEVTALSPGRRAAVRLKTIGMVYQFGELLPELSPLENVALPALMAGAPAAETYAWAQVLLNDLGVASVAGTDSGSLSGGERQRVAVARALIGKPRVILADEPTGALDGETSDTVADLLFTLPATHDCALIVVTHNPDVASRADRELAMRDGRLHPAHEGNSAVRQR
ncbi:ABC transporter ATP-binding protein [Streptomyces sp. NPDC020996]|uniref:ABC transporter ATP-binding protein n=1 Tax=Streptomyces sp. NPDC020996 TaxID=3154791 RepID=UPI00340C3254